MATVPATATRRGHRRRHRRQQPRPPPRPAGLARHRADRQGAAAQPRRVDRARVELHLPRGPLARDHGPDARLGARSTRRWASSPSPAASSSPAPRSGWRSSGAGCRRRRAWGIEAELVTPEFVKEKVPFIETDQFIGAFWTPSVGVVDSLRAGTIMRERALETGALTVVPTVEVTGLDTEEDRTAAPDHPGPDQRRRHRGRGRRHRLRRVEPEDRRHGRRSRSR